MRLSGILIAAGLSVVALAARGHAAPAEAEYKVVKTAKVGGAGGFDYVFADADGRKLYIPRSGRGGNAKSRVTVFDLDTLAPLGEIADTNGVHGVIYRNVSGEALVQCVRKVTKGETWVQDTQESKETAENDLVGARVRDRLTAKERNGTRRRSPQAA